MSYWQKNTINLGTFKQGKRMPVIFQGDFNIPEIESIVPDCGCTSYYYNPRTRSLKITYSNGKIPSQVVGPQAINKKILINYKNGEKEILTITGLKIR